MNQTSQAIHDQSEADNTNGPIELPATTPEIIGDTVVLFTLDGREYRIPTVPRAAVALRYLRNVRRRSTDYAAATLLEELLGVDGFDALCEYDQLKPEQFKGILAAAQKLTMGAFEEAFGGNSPGSSK